MTNKVNIQRAAAQRVPQEPLDSELASPERTEVSNIG